MAVTTRGDKPAAADAILFAGSSTNISKPTTELQDSGYATQTRPGSANYNWLFNYVSAGIAHEFVYGIAEFDANENYVANSYTNRLGLIYRSRTGSNTGNVPESSPSQWHDIRTPLEFTISAGETHNPQSLFHETLILDASLGGFTVALGTPAFDGQKVTLYVTDDSTATVYIQGTGTVTNRVQDGIYVGDGTGMPMTAGKTITIEGNMTLGIWLVPAVVVADYVSGIFYMTLYSNGLLITDTFISGTASTPIAAYFGTTAGTVYQYIVSSVAFAVPFTQKPGALSAGENVQTRSVYCTPTSTETGQVGLTAGNASGLIVSASITYKGKY